MKTPTNILELEGGRYALVKVELLEKYAPQLLPGGTPQTLGEDLIPWDVVRLTIGPKDMTLARAWREHLGLSQSDLAERMGVSQAAISKLERNETLKGKTRKKLAEALGIDSAQLY